MHETSLVRRLLLQVREIVTDNHAESAAEILVEIGPLAGVEIEQVMSAFEQLVKDVSPMSTRLTVHEVPLIVRCRDCNRESELNDFVFRCHECSSGRVQVVRGDEFRLVSVVLNESNLHA